MTRLPLPHGLCLFLCERAGFDDKDGPTVKGITWRASLPKYPGEWRWLHAYVAMSEVRASFRAQFSLEHDGAAEPGPALIEINVPAQPTPLAVFEALVELRPLKLLRPGRHHLTVHTSGMDLIIRSPIEFF